jgi:LysM repeat protein
MPGYDFNNELYYKFTRLDTKKAILVKRGHDAPSFVSGGARWNVVNRPSQMSFTTYEGSDPRRMDVPILFDGLTSDESTDYSVEDHVGILNHFRFPPEGDPLAPPPLVIVEGSLPVPAQPDIVWVVEDISFGDDVIWHENDYRLRQDAVVHLLQYIDPKQLKTKPPATVRSYHVARGDTLRSISKDQYGTAQYWRLIQKANNIRDPKKLPKRIRLPIIVNP